MKRTDEERFYDKVASPDPITGCQEWMGGKTTDGYGLFSSRLPSRVATHAALAFSEGVDVPSGMVVMHTCDHPPCVNPEHLLIGTVQDNRDDCVSKGRHATGDAHGSRTRPEARPRGETWARLGDKHGQAKLRDVDILQIRELLSRGVSKKEIAEMFLVSRPTISLIASGKTWKHVPLTETIENSPELL